MVANRKRTALPPDALTRMQRRVLHALRVRAGAAADPPTLDELCRALGLASRGSLHKHVRALVEAGLVEPMRRRQRGVRLAGDDRAGASRGDAPGALPLLGRVAAGRPIEALEHAEPVEVPAPLRGRGDAYVLEVRGDSMTDAGIFDGDLVVVEARSHARDGELVVALIDGREATLKRIGQAPGRVTLHAAHPAYPPLVLEPGRVSIRGVVTGLMRRYR